MTTRKCCVPMCYKTRSNIILHKFPNPKTDLERFLIWIDSIGDEVLFLDKNLVFNQHKICNIHFESKYRSGSGRLTRNAVPTLFLFSGKVLPRRDGFLRQVQSKPLHEPKECIASEEDRISEQVASNLVHISQRGIAPETDAISGQEQSTTVPQECLGPENNPFSDQVQNKPAQGGVVLKTYSKQVQSELVHIPQEDVVPEKDRLPYSEAVNNKPANIEQESIVPNAFSWEVQSEPVNILQDEPEHLDHDDVPDNLSMYCDDGDDVTGATQYAISTARHEGFHCDNCKGDIIGFRYTCVQCSNLDLCVTCESSGAHAHHYMLRVPGPRPYNEIQTILVRIRRHLMRELDPISAPDLDYEDAISVKSDVKSENEEEEVEDVEKSDPLCENMIYDDLKEDSRLLSLGSEDSKNKDSQEVSQNNTTVQQVKILKVKQDTRQSLFIRTPDENKPISSPNTAKRKIILSLAEFLKLKESNLITKKMCFMPSTVNKEVRVVPKTWASKPNAFNPVVKLSKLPPSGVLEQENLGFIQVRSLNNLQNMNSVGNR